MKNLSRDTRLAIGVLVLLVLVTVFAAVQKQVEQKYPPLSSLSSAQDGALALKLWLKELDYHVDGRVLDAFLPPRNVSILLMLEPQFPTDGELQAVDDWVEAGGMLIAVGEQYSMYALADHYGFRFTYVGDQDGALAHAAPLLTSPPAVELKNASVRFALRSERDDFVTLASYNAEPVVVSLEQGNGRVILATIPQAFTNAGLKQPGNPQLVLNILALAGTRRTVWFDEWHHGRRGGDPVLGPAEFLRQTPVGRSLLFVTFAVFLVLFLQGRGFGRPVPLPQEIRRRGALEHVTGIANLSRRAAHRSAVMLHYHQQIKRRLGQRYRLDPGLDDREYVEILASYHPSLDKNGLLDLLSRLKRKNISEAEMVHLAAEASKWIDT